MRRIAQTASPKVPDNHEKSLNFRGFHPNNCGVRIAQMRLGDFENEFQYYRTTDSGNGETTDMTLDSIPRDVTARIASVEATDAHGLRLMEMGLVPGTPVRVVKSAPLGDPIQVCIHNNHIALRRTEARSIQVMVEE